MMSLSRDAHSQGTGDRSLLSMIALAVPQSLAAHEDRVSTRWSSSGVQPQLRIFEATQDHDKGRWLLSLAVQWLALVAVEAARIRDDSEASP